MDLVKRVGGGPTAPRAPQDAPGGTPSDARAPETAGGDRGATAPRTIWVCDMHPEKVWDAPGECAACGGMKLEPRTIEPGSELVFACPDHPDARKPGPGTCEVCGKPLAFKIVSAETQTAEGYACPVHPDRTSVKAGPCPECGEPLVKAEWDQQLAVPVSAVVHGGGLTVVYVERSDGVFEGVEVTLGPRAGEWYAVRKGLAAGNRVVTAGAFLLDAENRLNPAAGVVYFGSSGSRSEPGKK